jgi:hypothetical protein
VNKRLEIALRRETEKLREIYEKLPEGDPTRRKIERRLDEIQRKSVEARLNAPTTVEAFRAEPGSVTKHSPPQSTPQPPTVNVNLPRPASGFAISGLIIGIVAAAIAWLPFVGLFVVPLAAIGLALSAISIVYILSRKNRGLGFAVTGGLLNGVAIALPLLITAGVLFGANEIAKETRAESDKIDADLMAMLNEDPAEKEPRTSTASNNDAGGETDQTEVPQSSTETDADASLGSANENDPQEPTPMVESRPLRSVAVTDEELSRLLNSPRSSAVPQSDLPKLELLREIFTVMNVSIQSELGEVIFLDAEEHGKSRVIVTLSDFFWTIAQVADLRQSVHVIFEFWETLVPNDSAAMVTLTDATLTRHANVFRGQLGVINIVEVYGSPYQTQTDMQNTEETDTVSEREAMRERARKQAEADRKRREREALQEQ